MLGPIFVAQIYDAWGPRVTFASSCAVLIVTIIVTLVFFRRLIPYADSPYRKRKSGKSLEDSLENASRSGCCAGVRHKVEQRIRDVRTRSVRSVNSAAGSLQ
jgi:hypothetical protein